MYMVDITLLLFYILYYLKFKSIFRNHLQEQQMEFPMDYVKEAFSIFVKPHLKTVIYTDYAKSLSFTCQD